jgi:hypothetical protein
VNFTPSNPAGRQRKHSAGARAHPHRSRRALTLVEIMTAVGILAFVNLGVLQAMLLSRRMTEGSIRQASVASLVQGYMEQFKSVKFATDASNALPSSPTASPGSTIADWLAYTGAPNPNPTLPAKNSTQAAVTICLVPGAALVGSVAMSGRVVGAARHTESVDIDNLASTADDSTLTMWVWVNDLTGTNVVRCKSIVVVYQWTVRDGGQIRTFTDMLRTIRSIVPTD